jgi:excisionase family DNA binding protein
MLGRPRCLGFGGPRIDAAVARELLQVVQPMAIEAAETAERMRMESERERLRMVELELQQARYEASLAERRYAACDPDNRLIAAQLEKNWETALQRVAACEERLADAKATQAAATFPDLTGLADELQAAWNAPTTTTRTRQRLLRALVNDIVADVDEEAREVVLVIHWRGGQHSQLRVRKPRTGEHGCSTSEEALEVMRSMAGRWSDEHIAASLNRMGLPTGQGKTWTAKRVASVRRVREIHAYRSAEKDGAWLTMTEAANALGVTNHVIRRLIKEGDLPAEQVVPGAPYQIRAQDLEREQVVAALARKGGPCRDKRQDTLPIISDT